MRLELAEMIVGAMGLYALVGVIVAIVVVTVGASRIDPAAKGMPLQARAIILPGAAILWPVMAWKLVSQKEPPIQ